MTLKLCAVLMWLSALTIAAMATETCGGNGRMVRQFSGRKEDTKMPCKYPALHQVCGNYLVTLIPGNIYLHPKYRLDSLWLAVKETGANSNSWWGGRTDNKISVKYLNGWKNVLFNKRDGDLNTQDVLVFGKDSVKTWADAKNGDFRVTFGPWDPDRIDFAMSFWTFECFSNSTFTAAGYPHQVCGGDDKQQVADRNVKLGLDGRDQVIYYDVFTNTDLAQTNPKCTQATKLMTTMCNEDQRRQAIITCSQILSSFKHAKCVTKYSCQPMDVFLDCVYWACTGFQDDQACEKVGRGIDMCRTFHGGNLTEKVEERKCYKDFLPIRYCD